MRRPARLLLMTALLCSSGMASADPLKDAVTAQLPRLLAVYRDLHANPELSGRETATARKLADAARQAGFKVTTGVGGTGVVAVMTNGAGPTLLIRTDMDGLPVLEETGLAYASKVMAPGADGKLVPTMHACGHDTHMAAWVGVANLLSSQKQRWSGTIVMIAQPAEETGSGSAAMLSAGLYSRFPKPDYAIAFHDSAALPAGRIGITKGYTFANVDSVDITVKGVGGHGAYPHLTRDPIVLASRIVTSLQTLVSRELDPLASGVVTVGSIHGGTKNNIIPDEVRLQLTVRSYTPEIRQQLLDGIGRIARGEAIAAGMTPDRMPDVKLLNQSTPAAFNTQPMTDRAIMLFSQRFGAARVAEIPPTMAGEDFSRYYLADKSIQSLLFWVGGVRQADWDAAGGDTSKLPSLHSAKWAPDADAVIATATEAITATALDILRIQKPD